MSTDGLRSLVSALRRVNTREEGCEQTLQMLVDILSRALPNARPARGIVHSRSREEGYRGLLIREFGAGTPSPVVPSASVWACVERVDAGVAIDLGMCVGCTLDGDQTVQLNAPYVAHDPSASVQEMLEREVTHAVALPLRDGVGASSGLAGMICIELAWPEGIGRAFPRGEFRGELEATAELAGSLLAQLPWGTRDQGPQADPLLPVVGERMRRVVQVLEVFVDQSETLLLLGPTGSGKSRLAEWCHRRSERASAPFETANLLAVPEPMQLAELFGWRKGAFTGAHADHEGLVASAEKGTLFLDEIDKLSMNAQASLLRLLETRRFSPLGAVRERTADVRFLVATNADLPTLVREGRFREDLFYRINVLPVRVPSLRERTDELPGWVQYMFERRHREANGIGRFEVAPECIDAIERRTWPGNLRQLDNVVRRAYALQRSQAAESHSPSVLQLPTLEQALFFEGDVSEAGSPRALDGLGAAAAEIVEIALEARRQGRTLPLDQLDVLRALVLRAAAERVGSVKDAFLLFGADSLVASRNHAAAYRKLTDELALFEEWLRGP